MGAYSIDGLIPPRCPATGEIVAQIGDLAPSFWWSLQFIDDPYCEICGVPFTTDYGAGVQCPSCIVERPGFMSCRASVVFNDQSAKLISMFKFGDRTELSRMFGQWMAKAGAETITDQSIILPVPLHWSRLLRRRFNQSALLAQAVGQKTSARVYVDALKRTRATPPQRETISAEARRRNVAGAFVVRDRNRDVIRGAHIVLIDDVLTTGATLSACANAIKRAGAARVDALVLARVVKGGGPAI